jgi:hypothetical protein
MRGRGVGKLDAKLSRERTETATTLALFERLCLSILSLLYNTGVY